MEPLAVVTLGFWLGVVKYLFVVLMILSCLLLIGVVLIQKGRGGGLSSAFGGAMGSSPFGTKTGDVFTWITVVLAAIFLGAALVLNVVYKPFRPETRPKPTPASGVMRPGPTPTATGQPASSPTASRPAD